ncbi:MAG: leucine-rich repeat protein [Oscillospiraceae bacterium]|nr:leucine-rich repeat protein [Oscillospiraceae bacterium]
MTEQTPMACPVCGGPFREERPCPRCGFDQGLWYERYATLSPATGLKSLRMLRKERQQPGRGRLSCPRCGGRLFSALLDKESLCCDACGFCLDQKQLREQKTSWLSSLIGEKPDGEGLQGDPQTSTWQEDPENCRILMDSGRAILVGYTGNCSMLRLPEEITVIGGHAFEDCSSLQQVRIPYGVREIGQAAFAGCRSLRQIVLPAGITTVQANTFANCSRLESVTLPEGLLSIEANAFYCCSALRRLRIPDSVRNISEDAFRWTHLTLYASSRWMELNRRTLEKAQLFCMPL